MNLRDEIQEQYRKLRELDRKVVTIFISVALLQTISWYFTSRRFFRYNLYPYFFRNPDVDLYSYLYWFSGDFLALFVIPVFIILFFLKEKPVNYGIQWGDKSPGVKACLVFLPIMLAVIWFASAAPSFTMSYPIFRSSAEDWNLFLLFHSAMVLYMLAWEFIWRGYMLFGLEERFGLYAVFIQMLPFVILHNGKPVAETFGAIGGALILGLLALRTRSFLYGVIIHSGVIFSIDFISVLRIRSQDFGIGINSMLNLLKTLF